MHPSECDWHKIEVVMLHKERRITRTFMRPTQSEAHWIFDNITQGELPGYHNWLSVSCTAEPGFRPSCPECNNHLDTQDQQNMLDKPGNRWSSVCRFCEAQLHRDTYLLDISGDPNDRLETD